MRQLWLLRHGEAVPHGSKPDDKRELTPRGERQAEAAGEAMAKLGMEFTACFTSPKVRARDTARLACAHLNVDFEELPGLAGGFTRDAALDLFHGYDDDAHVLIVGHEPDFSQIAFDLTGGNVDVKKGGLVGLRVERGSGELLVLLRPKELEAMARV